MRRFAFLLAAAAAGLAQTVAVAPASDPTATTIVTFTFRNATAIASFACNPLTLEPGQTSSCTVTLTQSAMPPGFQVLITPSAELSAPPNLTIAPNATSGTFTVTRAKPASASGPFKLKEGSSVTPPNEICLGLVPKGVPVPVPIIRIEGKIRTDYTVLSAIGGCLRLKFANGFHEGEILTTESLAGARGRPAHDWIPALK